MIAARAPLRISLGGGGTDLPSYCTRYGGFVLSAAIDKYVYVCAHRPAVSARNPFTYSRREADATTREVGDDLVRPALQLTGLTGEVEIASIADVPAGTGLGSSGAFLVALLTAIHALTGKTVQTHMLAEQASHIEMDLAGQPVGKHDHFVAAFGGITCLDIGTDERVRVTPLKLGDDAKAAFRDRVLLFYTGITRRSTGVLAEQQRDTEQGNARVLDSLHHTKALGYHVRECLERGDIEGFGLLLDEQWQHKKRRSANVSDPRLDGWYDLAKASGAVGGKIMGAGGGGFFMFCCAADGKTRLRAALTGAGLREMPYAFDFEGAKLLGDLDPIYTPAA